MVGKKIRAFREFRGYSQIQLAELSGINVGTIRKYELGIRNPKPDQLEKIATALGLNVSVFPVSYTHLDVYKRQLLSNTGDRKSMHLQPSSIRPLQ